MFYALAFAGLAAAQVSSIIDGQPQAPTAAASVISSIGDGQPQAPATVAPASTVAPAPLKTTTTYVTHLTTYCPLAGTSTFGSKTVTVTAPTTLTVSDCSCTLTNAVPAAPSAAPISYSNGTTLATVPAVPTGTAPVSPLTSTVFVSTCPGCPATVPVVVGPTQAPAAGVNGTSAANPTGALGAAPAKFTGAASKVSGAGAGLAAVFGLAAYLL